MREKKPPPPASPPPAAPDVDSSAGEEDPGASLGDPALRDAMQGEAQRAAENATRKAADPKKPGK